MNKNNDSLEIQLIKACGDKDIKKVKELLKNEKIDINIRVSNI